MDREPFKKAMKTSISELLETMFFLPIEFSERESDPDILQLPPDTLLCTSLEFHGPFSGRIKFLLPKELARTLTADFLGQERDTIGQHDAEETAKEMVNMITGRALSLYDNKEVFRLDIPASEDSKTVLSEFSMENTSGLVLLLKAIDDNLAVNVIIYNSCPSINEKICARSRKAKILTTGIH